MHLAYAARLLARKFPLMIAAALLGFAVSVGTLQQLQTWSTSAQVLVAPSADELGVRAPQPERYFRTQIQDLMNDTVISAAAEDLGQGMTATRFRGMLSLSGGADSDVLVITMTSPDEQVSRQGIRAVLAALEARPTATVSTSVISVGEPLPNLSSSRIVGGGTIGGLVLCAVLVLAWGTIRRPIMNPQHIELRRSPVKVYPVAVRIGGKGWAGQKTMLAAWLARRGRDRLIVPDLGTNRVAAALVAELQAVKPGLLNFVAADPQALDSTRYQGPDEALMVHVATTNKTSESYIETQSQASQGLAESGVLIVASLSRGYATESVRLAAEDRSGTHEARMQTQSGDAHHTVSR